MDAAAQWEHEVAMAQKNAALHAEVERLREELSGRHPSYQSALALLFTFVCPEESFDPTQPILMGKRIKDAVARLTGELAAVRRERDDVKEALHATVSNTESMTYGELPNSLQELIHPHEFDNMTISEQRAWSIGRFADVTQELDETLEAATQQYEEELAACRNPDHKMTLLESIKWLVAERNLALARNAALSALLHEWQQTPYFETHDHWSVWVTSFGARVEEALSQVRGGGHE